MINPSEISDILKQQLVDDIVKRQVAFEEEGTVLEVGDGVAHAYGLHNVEANELVQFENGVTGVAMNLEESDVGIILLDEVDTVTEDMKVRRTGEIASIEVGEGLLGRVINVLAKPIDGGGPIEGKKLRLPLERKAPGVIFRQPVNQPLQTGLKAIDSMIPIGRGQRELIIGDLHLCRYRTEGFDRCRPGEQAQGVGCHALYHRGGRHRCRLGVDALLRTLCRCRHR